MAWEIEPTEQWTAWFEDLTADQQEAITACIDLLQEHGPALGRPVVDTIKGSKIRNLKELRTSSGGKLRSLFVFDPRRQAILLVGGDKSGRWKEWYGEAIPGVSRPTPIRRVDRVAVPSGGSRNPRPGGGYRTQEVQDA